MLLGPNGAGKSTLMRILAKLLGPTSGHVYLPGSRYEIGYMAHASMLYDELSGIENLRYFAGLYGITDEKTCVQAMREVGLDPGLERRVRDYSQGMRQRLSLARAIVHGPKVILLDEPFSNVDAASTTQMTTLLGKLRDEGKTVIVITHQPAALAAVADEYLHMHNGRIVERSQRATMEAGA